MKLKFSFCIGAVLLLTLLTDSARAGSLTNLINVQYRGVAGETYQAGFSSTTYSGSAVLGSAGDTWNAQQVHYYSQGGGNIISGASLVNSANSASGLTLTLNYVDIVQGATYSGTATDPATTNLMGSAVSIYNYNGGGTGNTTTTHTIGGLSSYAGAVANLVVYAAAKNARTENIAITGGASGGNSGSTLTTSSTSRQLSAGAGVAYNIFTNLTLTGGNLVFTVNEPGATTTPTPQDSAFVNGFQLQIISPNPSITTQPVSTNVAYGQTATFSVVASASPTPAYQWQAGPAGGPFTNLVNGGQISGATTSTLTITNVTANWALAYQVIVTNSSGSVTSSPAAMLSVGRTLIDVDVGQGPVQTGAAVLGSSSDVAWNGYSSVGASSLSNLHDSGNNTLTGVGLNVSAGLAYGNDTTAGTLDAVTTPLMQDFLYNGTSLTASVTGLAAYQNYPYTLVVYAAGTTYSGAQAALVTVTAGSSGTTPASATVTSSSRKISLGNGVAYQTFTGILTNSTLTFTLTQAGASGVNLNGFQLQLVQADPLITANPVSRTNVNNTTATFSVAATGSATISYQWQAGPVGGPFTNLTDGGQILGSVSNVLTISSLTTNWAGAYQVIVSNSDGSVTSTPAILTVLTSPIITVQPVSQTALNGNTASFNVTALGTAPLSYQWQTNGPSGYVNLTDGGQIFGSGTNVLTISNVSSNWALSYRVIVSNGSGSITSTPAATLTVYPNTLNINVDFGSGTTQSGAAVLGSLGDVWNAVSATTGTIKNSANATLSGVGLTLNSSGVFTDTGGTAMDAATTALMQDYAYGNNSTVTVSLNGLAPYTNSPFTLVVYSAGDNSGQGGSFVLSGATGGNTTGALNTSGVSRQISAGPGVAYNTFNGTLTNGTLTFTCTAVNGQQFTEVNGFQLRFAPATNDPSLLVAPVSQTVPSGSTASFNVTAAGTAPFYYQWQAYSGTGFTNLTNGGQISGANTNVLTVSGVTASYVQPNWNWAGNYRVIVTNSVGSITSSPATLVVAVTGVYVAPGGDVNGAVNTAYNNGGGTVNLGPGTYYGNVNMWENVTLNGAGSNTIIAGTVTQATTDSSGFYRDNITIQNLVIDGMISCSSFSVGGSGAAGIFFGGYYPVDTHNLTFNNVEVKNTSIAMQIVNASGVHLNNCNFHDNGIGFSHSIYFTGDYDVEMYNCISSWTRTGDGAHLDFSSNIGAPNIFTQCEFNGAAGIGILNQQYNNSGNDIHITGCKFQFNAISGGDGSGIDTDLSGYVQASRLDYNHGYGAIVRDNVGLFYDYFNANYPDLYNSYGPVADIASGTPPNEYDAVLADGVTGVNNTADWNTVYTGSGSAVEGVVDFNANHSANGSLTWSIVSSTVNGSRPLIIYYSNGTSTNLTMAMIVNGGATNLLTFPPTGAWTTYSTINTSATLTKQNNQVKMQVAYPGATSPELSALVVNDSVPGAPAAPTGLTYLALTNAPKYDLSAWIQLNWNQVPGATYYDIQRNGLWLAINVPTNTFTDKHVWTSGSAQTYNIIAVNAGGSSGSSITAYSLTGFPISLSATANGAGSISLSCNASANAQYYNVYRATNANGPFIEIATNVGTSYTDNAAPGGTDYYYMTADNGLTESLPSPIASATVATLVLSITNEPASQTNSIGANVSFTVGAVGYPVLTYQWQATNSATGGFTNLVNGGSISGATNATLTLTGITTNQALAYQVIVTNYQGSVTSSPATTLTVNLSPNITNQPASQNIFGGRNASFIVGAVGLAPLSYQWQSGPVGGPYANLGNGGKFSGATSNVLTIASVTTNQMQAYRVIVSNSYGSVTSSPAVLTVQTTLLIDVDVGGGPVQTGAAVLGTSSDTAWNSYSSTPASSLSNLHDSGSNTLTGVGLNVSTGLAYGNDTTASTLDAATTPLMQDFLFNNGPNLTASVTGLAAYNNCPYTLVVYAAGTTYSGAQAALVTVTAGSSGTSPASGVCTSTSRKISAGVGVAYQTFTGILTNSTLTFALTQASTGGYNLNGFQLQVNAPAPTVSANANLTSLALSSALTFTPSFSSSILTYAATEAYGNAPTVTVTNADLTATNQLIYGGATNGLASGAASAPLTLALGVTNVVTVRVTAQDGVTKQTYTVNVVEQPSQTKPVLTSSVSGGSLNLSWPTDHLGYRLLTQTNNLNLGVSANINDWATVPGSTATNSISLPIISTNLNNYYRLVYP
jgi:fibronectin type 3 domain-containing protein